MEELRTRHKKEQKDLHGRISQKKKNATKKTRKGVNDECDRLERDLQQRQQGEIDAFDGDQLLQSVGALQVSDPTTITNDKTPSEEEKEAVSATPSVGESAQNEQESDNQQRSRKPNRQKARLARRAAEQEAQAAVAAEEAANQPDLRKQEMTAMDEHKKKLGLSEIFIRPDGNCLFSACAHGMPPDVIQGSGPYTEGYQNVRLATANFMSQHRGDFEAFLEEPFDSYVSKIKNTSEWGGHLELQAISRAYHVTVNVLQSDGRVERFVPEETDDTVSDIWLAYYRHSFGLGEHYNALRKT